MIKAGQRVGRYELGQRLGAGGLGEVWTATLAGPMGFQRRYAIKLIRLDAGGDPAAAAAMTTALVNEARLCGRLEHPNVVPVVDCDEDAGLFFAVQEFVPGVNLQQLLERGRGGLPVPAVLEIGRQIAAGLAHAHGLADERGEPLGVVHRDIKPANIMVTPDGTVRVLDFGIARSRSNVEQTRSGEHAIRGTMAYMAPEQLDASRVVDGRTDLHALGLVLFELCLGRRLYRQREPIPLIHEILHADRSTDLGALGVAAPQLGPLVERLLTRDPGGRPGSATEVQIEIEQLLVGDAGASALRSALGVVPTGAVADTLRLVGLPDTIDSPPASATARAPEGEPAADRPALPWRAGVATILAVAALWGVGRLVGVGAQPEAPRELVLLGLELPGEDAPTARWALLHQIDPLTQRLDRAIGPGLAIPGSISLAGRVLDGGVIDWVAARRSDGESVDPAVLVAAAVPPAPALGWTGGITASFGRVPVSTESFYSSVVSLTSADGAPLAEGIEWGQGLFAKELTACLPEAVRGGRWQFRAEVAWTVRGGAWVLDSLRAMRPEAFATTQSMWGAGLETLRGLEACLASRPWPPAPKELDGRDVVTTLLVGGLGPVPARVHPGRVAAEEDLPLGPSELRFQTGDLRLRYSAADTAQTVATLAAFDRALPTLTACESGLLAATGVHRWLLRSRVVRDPEGVAATTTPAARSSSFHEGGRTDAAAVRQSVLDCIDARLEGVAWPPVDRRVVIEATGVYDARVPDLGPPGTFSREEAAVALTLALGPRRAAMAECLRGLAPRADVVVPAPYLELQADGSVAYSTFRVRGVPSGHFETGCMLAMVDGLELPATGFDLVLDPEGGERPPALEELEGVPLDSETIVERMSGVAPHVRACWERRLRAAPEDRGGKMVLRFDIGVGGGIAALKVTTSSLADSETLTDCVALAILDAEFPPTDKEIGVIGYPYEFSP